jgi:hypothetical protein
MAFVLGLSFVMPGLVPGIPIHWARLSKGIGMAGTSPAMTGGNSSSQS